MIWAAIVLLLVVVILATKRRPASSFPACPPIEKVPPFRFEDRVVRRVAKTSKELRKGLGGYVISNTASPMLFVHAYESPKTYTLAPMKVPITIEFFDKDRRKVEHKVEHAKNGSMVRSKGPACYVLETIL